MCVTPPPDALTVSVEVFTPALDATFSVSVLLPPPGEAMLVGTKVAVTPLGAPLTDSATAALNPSTTAVVIVIGTEPPRATMTFAPPSAKVKSGPITVRLSACVFVTPPPDAVTVSAYTPATLLATALKVSMLLPVPGDAMLAGANFAATPVGKPPTDSVIADLNPLTTAVL